MRAPIYKNREFIFLVGGIVIIALIGFGLLLAGISFSWNRANTAITERNLALLGGLIKANPELGEEDIGQMVLAFTRETGPGDLDFGREISGRYGYSREMPLSTVPVLGRWHSWSLAVTAGLGFFLLLALAGAVYISFDGTYRRLSSYNLGAEQIMRGDYSVRFPENGEGDLAILGFQFNQLARRLESTFAALEEEKVQVRAMISGISHQLKTPLASSRVFAELLLEGAGKDPEILQEFLHKNLNQLERMEWLIHSLLKLSRLESGVIEFKKGNENLGETIAGVVSALEEKAASKGQSLDVNLGASLPVPHDRAWLAEAITNILDNAIRYTPQGGRISVSLEQTDSTAVVSIRDTGPGIPPDELSRIFQRFYQGSSRGDGQGSGIGLALTKLIVEKHGGIVQAGSPGQGSVFTVTLPRAWVI